MIVTRPRATPAKVSKPMPKAVPKAAPEAPSRRLRLTSSNTAVDTALMVTRAKAAIEEQLKVISKSESDIDAAKEQIDKANKVIEAQLKLAGLTLHTDGAYLAEIIEQWTNQSRNVDPKKFRTKTTNEVFWACIEVSLTKAKAHMTEKELNEIADVVPAQFKGQVLKIKKLEPKRRGKK